MKKILTLVLCWLLAFSAMAENTFKAYSSASVAGGYVTSLNKVDGSFEDEFTQWSASVGTIVPTASTEFQGNNIGVWAGTGTGTLDLQWTATASNTYEASAQVDVQGEDDVSICAYVGPTETGCKLIPALSKIQKVSVVADSVMSSAFYLRLKHAGSDAFSVKVDDGKIEPWTPQAVNLVEQEYVGYSGWSSGNAPIVFTTKDTKSTDKNLLQATTSRITIKKPCYGSVIASYQGANGALVAVTHYSSSGATKWQSVDATGSGYGLPVRTGYFEAGDYFEASSSASPQNFTGTNFSAICSAISENVVQSWQPSDFLGEIKLLPSTTAPRGFIPADGKSIGKTSGNYQGDAYYALYALRWVMASTTAGEPYVISSAKGASAQADWDAGKTITIDVRGMFFRAAGGNAGTVGSKQADAFQDHKHDTLTGTIGTYGESGFSMSRGLQTSVASREGDLTGSASFASGSNGNPRIATETRPINTSEYAYMRYGTSAPDLIALPTSQINNYGAEITSAYAVVSGSENVSWISSITNPSAGITRIFVKTDVVNPLALNIQITPKMSGTGNYNFYAQVSDVTSTYIDVRTGYTSGSTTAFAAYPFFINLEKRGSDYKAPGVMLLNTPAAGMNYTSGAPDQVHTFSFSYGTTNATTVCSASPCSYLDQIGNYVTSVTRGGAGNYTVNFSRTYSKLKCSATVTNATTSGAKTPTRVSCESCSSLQFYTEVPQVGAYDTSGTFLCQGQ